VNSGVSASYILACCSAAASGAAALPGIAPYCPDGMMLRAMIAKSLADAAGVSTSAPTISIAAGASLSFIPGFPSSVWRERAYRYLIKFEPEGCGSTAGKRGPAAGIPIGLRA